MEDNDSIPLLFRVFIVLVGILIPFSMLATFIPGSDAYLIHSKPAGNANDIAARQAFAVLYFIMMLFVFFVLSEWQKHRKKKSESPSNFDLAILTCFLAFILACMVDFVFVVAKSAQQYVSVELSWLAYIVGIAMGIVLSIVFIALLVAVSYVNMSINPLSCLPIMQDFRDKYGSYWGFLMARFFD